MSAWQCMALLWSLAALVMTAGWLWQRKHRNAGIVDVLWTSGIGGGAILYAAVLDGAPLPRALLGILAGLWSLRLALHLARRVFGEPEDGRYRQLREHWHGHQGKMFLMFQFQALLIVLFSFPFLAVARNPAAAPTLWTVAPFGLRASPENRSPIGNWRDSARILPIGGAPAAPDCGVTRAIRIISSNGCIGSPTSRSPSAAPSPGCRWRDPSSCTCFCAGSAAFLSPKRRRCVRGVKTTAATSNPRPSCFPGFPGRLQRATPPSENIHERDHHRPRAQARKR